MSRRMGRQPAPTLLLTSVVVITAGLSGCHNNQTASTDEQFNCVRRVTPAGSTPSSSTRDQASPATTRTPPPTSPSRQGPPEAPVPTSASPTFLLTATPDAELDNVEVEVVDPSYCAHTHHHGAGLFFISRGGGYPSLLGNRYLHQSAIAGGAALIDSADSNARTANRVPQTFTNGTRTGNKVNVKGGGFGVDSGGKGSGGKGGSGGS